MYWKQAFLTRDEMFYQSVISHFSHDGDIDEASEAKIAAAFQDGEKLWRKHLVAVFGEIEARRILNAIERNEPVEG